MFYSLNANWFRLMMPTLADMLPIPQRYYVPARMRESHRPRLEAVRLWNLPGIEQEDEKPHFWEREKLKEPAEGDRKERFKRVFEREKVSCENGFIHVKLIDLDSGTRKGAIIAEHIRPSSREEALLL